MSRVFWGFLAGLMTLFGVASASAEQGLGTDRPNILLITADNLGYGDLPCFNPDSTVLAPRLDRLAQEGAKLTQFYTASPTCTVSRACLLTGRIAGRHGLTDQLPGIAGNYGRGLDPMEILIPQVLGKVGYATGCFGKWNIGFAPGSRPTERGFDEFFGHASGNIDYYTHNYNRKHDLYRGIEAEHVEGYSTDLFAEAAIDFIRRRTRDEQPWLAYLPFNAPHFPNSNNKAEGEPCVWQAPDAAFRAYGYDPATQDERQRYRAVITSLDAAIGRVLDALDELSIAEKTFVVFYSDNGAFMLRKRGLEVASNAPLRDGGVTCWEGGIRVPALVRWPQRIDAGDIVDQPLWSPDLFTACVELAGADPPPGIALDGRDPLPVLTGKQERSRRRSLFFEYRKQCALRLGDWKIVRTDVDDPWKLFDLSNDVGERTNLAATEPQRLERLVAEFSRWKRDIAKQERHIGKAIHDDDPLAPIVAPHVTSTVDVVLRNYRTKREYGDDRFPMPAKDFGAFRDKVVGRLAKSLRLEDWVVRQPTGKLSPLADRFVDRVLRRIELHDVEMEVHAIEFPDSGLVVPMVVCLPDTEDKRPGICVFSGHTRHGLRDTVIDLDSYQRGLAVRLAKAGFVTVAVEKIDAGYLSRDGRRGVDENEVATTLLHWGQVTRAHQLKACLAAAEILATHPRVDEGRIGATGVSLGGWLAIQTALLSDRVAAVADFGRKTLAIAPGTSAGEFAGQRDLCHVLPGMLSLCDRNVLALAYCPRPLLAGHGSTDAGSHREGPIFFERLFRRQYDALGRQGEFEYLIHDGGDDMPAEAVIDWFERRFPEARSAR